MTSDELASETGLAGLRSDLNTEIGDLRSEMRSLREEMNRRFDRAFIAQIATVVTLATLILAT